MKRLNKVCALLLAVILLLSLMAPAALAAEDGSTIHIQNAGDLTTLAESCRLDTWSQGKTVVLDNDIDLSGKDFTPIPTFGGTFDGQGHTISGLSITGSGDSRGLFRYIQSGGLVQNLTVSGTISPSDRQNKLGGIVGRNYGTISACTFTGAVEGEDSVGGIAGVNEASGQIVNCTSSAAVTGDHSVGGIAGENLGGITRCVNSGSVNIDKTEIDTSSDGNGTELPELDLEDLNSTQNMPACTDVGGIAGYSTGVIQSCQNSGEIGYPHVGYNIGGIAGRQAGYLDGCTNTGAVRGRKDVGGIAGQLEPEVIESFSQDFLDKLLNELDILQDLMDATLNDGDAVSDNVSSELHTLTDKGRTVQDSAKTLMDLVTDWGNGNIDQINDMTARISWTLDQMNPVMDEAVDTLDDLQQAADHLDDALDDAIDASDYASDAMREAKRGLEDLDDSIDAAERYSTNVQSAIRRVINNLGGVIDAPSYDEETGEVNPGKINSDGVEAELASVMNLMNAMLSYKSIFSNLQDSIDDLSDSLDSLDDADQQLTDAMEDLQDAGNDMDDVISGLTTITEDVEDIIQTLSDMPDIQFAPIDETITDQGDLLNDAMTALLDEADALNQVVTDSSDLLLGDMRAINQQFRVIINLIRDEKNDWDSKDLEEHLEDRYEDVSDQGNLTAMTKGRLSASRNEGTVEGDLNVAGVAGSIAIEYDFDPEDDLTEEGSRSTDFLFKTRAVLFSCVNTGEITGKKDYTGGITGRMDLGRVSGCENYGLVTSTDGNYVGGIAGASYGSVRNSWSRCTLSGTDYVGGVAGLGSTLTDCSALVNIQDGESYLGAIAGDLDDDEDIEVSGNRFTSDTLGGIDGISYGKKAAPVTFGELCSVETVPAAFAQLELTFTADGETVAVVPFQYGEGIDSLPEIPAKKGYSAAWPEIDYTHITSAQTLEAIYTPYSSALSEGGDLPEILVDGSFSSSAKVSHTTEEVTWTDEQGTERSGTAYTVKVSDPDLKDISYTVHYRLPDSGERYTLWLRDGDTWVKTHHDTDGSYLLVPVQTDTVTFCVLPADPIWPYVAAGAGAAALVLLIAILLLRWRKKRRKKALEHAASDLESNKPES